MNKFENVDVFSALNAIMKQNTGFYQSDFEIDKDYPNNLTVVNGKVTIALLGHKG